MRQVSHKYQYLSKYMKRHRLQKSLQFVKSPTQLAAARTAAVSRLQLPKPAPVSLVWVPPTVVVFHCLKILLKVF